MIEQDNKLDDNAMQTLAKYSAEVKFALLEAGISEDIVDRALENAAVRVIFADVVEGMRFPDGWKIEVRATPDLASVAKSVFPLSDIKEF